MVEITQRNMLVMREDRPMLSSLMIQLVAFFGYIPIFSSFAILILKKIGVYGLIISFLAYFYFYVVKYFISVIQSNTQYYGNGNILLGILNTILTLPVFLLVFWTLYFYAIKRKWHLFS